MISLRYWKRPKGVKNAAISMLSQAAVLCSELAFATALTSSRQHRTSKPRTASFMTSLVQCLPELMDWEGRY